MTYDRNRGEVPRLLQVSAAYSWRFLTVVAAAAVIVYILVTLRLIVIPAFIALLLSTLLVPVADRLKRAGVPPLLAAGMTFFGGIGLMGAIVFLIAPQVADQLGNLGRDARRGIEDVVTWLVKGPLDLTRAEVDNYLSQIGRQISENRSSFVSGGLRGAYLLVEIIAGAMLTFVMTFFFIKDGDHISRGVLGLFSEDRHDALIEVGARSWRALSAYIRGTAIVGLVNAAVIGVALLILGVPLVLPLVIITFLGAFFPLVGAVVAGALGTLVALVTVGVVPAAIVAGVTIVVQQVEGDVLQPLVLGRAVKLHPLVILLSLTAGAIIAGVAGAFLAVPIAAVVSASVAYLREA